MELFGTYKATLVSKEYIKVSSFSDFTSSVNKLRKIALKKADTFLQETIQNIRLEAIGQQINEEEASPTTTNNSNNMTLEQTGSSKPSYHISNKKSGKNEKMSKKRTLGEKSVKILNQWFYDHLEDPYPSRIEKTELSQRTGLRIKQVTGWFINKRMRKLTKNGLKKNFQSKIKKQIEQENKIEEVKHHLQPEMIKENGIRKK